MSRSALWAAPTVAIIASVHMVIYFKKMAASPPHFPVWPWLTRTLYIRCTVEVGLTLIDDISGSALRAASTLPVTLLVILWICFEKKPASPTNSPAERPWDGKHGVLESVNHEQYTSSRNVVQRCSSCLCFHRGCWSVMRGIEYILPLRIIRPPQPNTATTVGAYGTSRYRIATRLLLGFLTSSHEPVPRLPGALSRLSRMLETSAMGEQRERMT